MIKYKLPDYIWQKCKNQKVIILASLRKSWSIKSSKSSDTLNKLNVVEDK